MSRSILLNAHVIDVSAHEMWYSMCRHNKFFYGTQTHMEQKIIEKYEIWFVLSSGCKDSHGRSSVGISD